MSCHMGFNMGVSCDTKRCRLFNVVLSCRDNQLSQLININFFCSSRIVQRKSWNGYPTKMLFQSWKLVLAFCLNNSQEPCPSTTALSPCWRIVQLAALATVGVLLIAVLLRVTVVACVYPSRPAASATTGAAVTSKTSCAPGGAGKVLRTLNQLQGRCWNWEGNVSIAVLKRPLNGGQDHLDQKPFVMPVVWGSSLAGWCLNTGLRIAPRSPVNCIQIRIERLWKWGSRSRWWGHWLWNLWKKGRIMVISVFIFF